MRLFIEELPKHIDITSIEEFLTSTCTQTLLLSNEGIFNVTERHIYEVIFEESDKLTETVCLGNVVLIVDYSHTNERVYMKTPFKYNTLTTRTHVYKINSTTLLLKFNSSSNELVDAFFQVQDDELAKTHLDDIYTFVSYLKLS